MKWILTLAVITTAVALAPAPASGDTVRKCRAIAFTPHSDDMAGDIRAVNVSCRTARRFIRAVDGNAPARFRGYRCTRKDIDTALPSRRYRCVDGAKRISWVKT